MSPTPIPTARCRRPIRLQAQFPSAYVPQRVEQVETPGGGTKAVVSNVQPGTVAAYDPTAPYADQSGMVAEPNVNYANEAVQQMTARYNYVFNVYVMRVYSRMMKSLVDVQT
ncbi:MAG TPA: flagellar basal body rod C-terminal domain-containing protein [Xanthobacteraceae bacterium]|jgi:flagellar basal-body rod protein FlgC|nr:flagellar basal body rod C-terminal domain-containing protein [Xanthobacteraceae bacterium]